MIYGHCIVTFPNTEAEILIKMAHIVAHLNCEIDLVGCPLNVAALTDITPLSPLLSYCRYHFCEPGIKLG